MPDEPMSNDTPDNDISELEMHRQRAEEAQRAIRQFREWSAMQLADLRAKAEIADELDDDVVEANPAFPGTADRMREVADEIEEIFIELRDTEV